MIEAHKGAFEHDWRARFRLPLKAIGKRMSWGEAYRLTQNLATDPSSWVGAALAGWDYPATREALVLMDYYDAFAKAHFKRPDPYPRPWPDRTKRRPRPTVSQRQVIAALRSAGHTGPLPSWAAVEPTGLIDPQPRSTCRHEATAPVTTLEGEVVGHLCLACDERVD